MKIFEASQLFSLCTSEHISVCLSQHVWMLSTPLILHVFKWQANIWIPYVHAEDLRCIGRRSKHEKICFTNFSLFVCLFAPFLFFPSVCPFVCLFVPFLFVPPVCPFVCLPFFCSSTRLPVCPFFVHPPVKKSICVSKHF